MAPTTSAWTTCPIPRSSTRPTRSSASPRPGSADPTCTSTRSSAPFIERRRRARARADGRRRGGRRRGHQHRARRPRRDPLQRLLRALLHVREGTAVAVRDHAGSRVRHGRRAARLHEALRPGARRSGRVPARAAGAVRADQGPRGAAGRPLRLPVRRAPHRVAGGRVRRRAQRRNGARARPRPDRRDVRPASPSTEARAA